MKRAAYLAIGLAVAAAIVIGFVRCGRSAGVPNPVATVNGVAIPSADFIKLTTLQAGRQVLQNQIEEEIILKWADDEKVAPTDEQVNRQIETLKRDGIFDDQVRLLGEDTARKEVKGTLARANLYKKFNKISDADLKQAYEMMKANYVHGPRKRIAIILNSDKSKVDEAAKAAGEGKDFDKLAADYGDSRFMSNGGAIRLWVVEDQPGLPNEIKDAAKSTKTGAVSSVFTVAPRGSPTEYAVLKVLVDQPKSDVTFDQAKPEVEDYVAWQKSQPPYDTGTFLEKLNEQKKKADIKINMDQLYGTIASFKNPPAPMPPPPTQPGPAPKPATPAKPAKPAKPGK